MRKVFLGMLMGMAVFSLCLNMQGCAKKKKGVMSDQLGMSGEDMQMAALKGEDIPLTEQPDLGSFVEPNDSSVFADVRFDYDQSQIRDDARPILEGIAKWLEEHSGIQLMIEGHCDERGSNEYNLALGEQRGLAIRRYLTGLGLDAERLHTVSYGEEKPLDPSHNEDAWSQNRRGHFLISAQ
ncbi:MAG: peptidoglycan-associated lipoprotein Pal [Chlamydiae bacterium]|nr:peptidoglycan-associated lipoprotein Pal [Chlamydiota bacterium]MBI3265952.1 peptidoglycan-associated lipoprotein Pal [Chlamydiota bacterium]